jgi:hypothetical protein
VQLRVVWALYKDRRMKTTVMLVTALASLAVAAVAHAEAGSPAPLSDRRDHSHIGATLGLFTPTGELGVEYSQALHPNLELDVGAGVGLVRVGPQFSVMPRARIRRGPVTLLAGAGLSVGKFNNISAFAEDNAPQIKSLFGNVEGGLQVAIRQGVFARFSLGAGKILAHEDYMPKNDMERNEVKDVIPYGGLTVGYLF